MGLFRRSKNNSQPLIKQVLNLVPRWLFDSCTNTYNSNKGCSKYKAYDQFVALTFGQLNKCQSLNDISAGIGINEKFISDLVKTKIEGTVVEWTNDKELIVHIDNYVEANKAKKVKKCNNVQNDIVIIENHSSFRLNDK